MQTAEQMVMKTPTEAYVDRLAAARYARVDEAVAAAVAAARRTGTSWVVINWPGEGQFTIEEADYDE